MVTASLGGGSGSRWSASRPFITDEPCSSGKQFVLLIESKHFVSSLVHSIEKCMEKGYVPSGSMIVNKDSFYQSMIKKG